MNRKPNFASKLISVLVGLTLILSATQPVNVNASAPTAQGDGIRRSVHPQTGKLTFLGADPANPIRVSAAMGYGLAPEARGNSILDVYGPEFGIQDAKRELAMMKSSNADGRLMVRYQQVFNKIPVMGGELIVNMNEDGSLLSINGEVSPDLKIDVLPRVNAQKAKQAALTAIAKSYNLKATDLTVTEPELWIYDARLLNGDDLTPAHLVWRMEVTSATAPVRELVLVNAKSGGISLHFNQIDTAWTGESVEMSTALETKNSTPAENLVRRDYEDALDVHTTRLTSTSDLNTNPDKGDYQPLGAPVSGTNLFVNGTGGNDANDCLYPASACLTIGGAIGKPQAEGNSIYVAEGMFTGVGNYVVLANKNVNLSGGWSNDFITQTGYSTIDGENARRVVIIDYSATVVMDRFIIQHGYFDGYSFYYDGGAGVVAYGNLTLAHSIIQNNTIVNGSGGGMFVHGGKTFLLTDSVVSNNTGSNGGGIFSFGNGTINNSTIANNKAVNGGGINSGVWEINNSTIVDNKAESGGGLNVSGPVTLNNSTIAGNFASISGGGIYTSYSSAISMKNSIIVGSRNTCGHSFSSSTFISLGNNLFNQTCEEISLVSSDLNVSDPKIGPYLPEQGFLPLHADSPAINHGNPSTCYSTSDQRGQPRVGVCDIGAFEYTTPGAPAAILAVAGDHQTVPPNRDYSKPLTAIVLDANANLVSGVSVTFTSPVGGPSALFESTGTHANVVTTGVDGSVSTSTLTANSEYGAFSVQAAVSGLLSTSFSLENLMWTVLPTGSDSNTCKSPATPCLTIQAAVSKSSSGDTVFVSADTYTGAGSQVVQLTKDVTLSGGWNNTFDTQSGKTTIDGEGARRGITVGSWLDFISVNVDHFIVTNGKNPGTGNSLQTDGGGIYVMGGNNLSLRDSQVSGNRAVNGGGINAEVSTNMVIDRTVIRDNRATTNGGGVNVAGSFTISNSSIHSNSASGGKGGGINIITGIDGNVITNTTIAKNRANAGGGLAGNKIDLLHVSIIYNSARFAGGIANLNYTGDQLVRLGNSILAYNESFFHDDDLYQRGNCLSSSGIVSLGSSIVYPRCPVLDADGANFLLVDPKLDALVPELGYAPLMADSPAINAGKAIICTSTDQRGQPRSGLCDIGAFEFIKNTGTPTQLQYVSGDAQRARPNSTFAQPPQVMLLDVDGNPVANQTITFTAPASGASAVFAESGTTTAMIVTDGGGNASVSATANGQVGDYVVSASHATGTVNFNLSNGAWYAAPAADGGNDSNDCKSPATPCATFGSIFSRPDYYSGDVIQMLMGNYPATDANITLTASTVLSGGWEAGFMEQSGVSTLDFTAYPTRTITVPWDVSVSFDHMDLLKTKLINYGNAIFRYGSIRNGKSVNNLGYFTFENATLFGNTGTNSTGGGLENGGIVRIWNATITGNSASSSGGGIVDYRQSELGTHGKITLGNTILIGNTAPSGPECGSSYISLGNNLIGVGCGESQTASDLIGTTTSPIHVSDVLVPAPVQDSTSGQWYYPLMLGSLAIDAGNQTDIGSDVNSCLPTDQLGVNRPRGMYCDIGASEFNGFNSSPTLLLRTFDLAGSTSIPATSVCDQTDLTCAAGGTEAQSAHRLAAGFYNFLQSKHSRHSLDHQGMEILIGVRYGSNYQNTFWNGYMALFGSGYDYAQADDVVAHELTHGFTQWSSRLFPWYQSGAISESFSDLWGEAFDQIGNVTTGDTPAVKWLIGEDVTGLGAFRNMQNPPAFRHPDTMTSTHYCTSGTCLTSDNGGIHTNSGVNNKAISLMVEGGTFNSRTVIPLGWDKVLVVYYEAQTNLLTSGSDYLDLYNALYQACQNKVGSNGILAGDCQQVRAAIDAVKMNQQPLANFNPDADICPSNHAPSPTDLYAEDFESGTDGWTFLFPYDPNVISPTQTMWSLRTLNASSGTHALWGDDTMQGVNFAKMATDINLPSGSTPFLHFTHSFGFKTDGTSRDGGGAAYYSTDNGYSWFDLGDLFSGGQDYNGRTMDGTPLFKGDSHGFVKSRYDLSSLAGHPVRFAWYLSSSSLGGDRGWYLDDVRVNLCYQIPSVPVLWSPNNGELLADFTPVFDWYDSTGNPHHYELQLATDAGFSLGVINFTDIPLSTYSPPTDLASITKYYWRVRSVNAVGGASMWSASRYFSTSLQPPNSLTPGNIVPGVADNVHTRRPTFTWDAVPGATGYSMEVSPSTSFLVKTITASPKTTSYTPVSDLAANTVFYWRVKATGTKGPSAYSQVRTFRTGNPPPAPSLSAPASNALVTDYTPAFDWSDTAPAGGYYELQLATDSAFRIGVVNINNIPVSNYTPLADLAYNTKFYWRVRAYNVAGDFSAWTTSRYFRTALLPPNSLTPGNVVPGVADNVHTRRPTFTWEAVPGATGYTLEVSTTQAFSSKAINKTLSTTTYTHTADIAANTIFYWRVKANGTNGPSAYSQVRTFTTGNPPSVPTLSAPMNNALVKTLRPFFDWRNSTLPSLTTFAYYEIQLSTNGSFTGATSYLTMAGDIADSDYTPLVDLVSGTTYYWRVRSWNTNGDFSGWSSVRTVRIP